MPESETEDLSQHEDATPKAQHSADYLQHYLSLHNASTAIINASFIHDKDRLIAKSHSFVSDLELWLEVLENRPELPVLRAAMKEYQFAILALLQGHYRQSFVSLRLFFELTLAAIRFSAHEIEYWLWEGGEHDIKWATLVERDAVAEKTADGKDADEADSEKKSTGNAVLSVGFVQVFSNPTFASLARAYRKMATTVYRECSEFVHGNSQTHNLLPNGMGFSGEVMESWLDRADTIKLVVLYALCARHAKFLNAAALGKIEPTVADALGHVEVVREYLDLCITKANEQ